MYNIDLGKGLIGIGIFALIVGALLGAGLLKACEYGCAHIEVTVEAR